MQITVDDCHLTPAERVEFAKGNSIIKELTYMGQRGVASISGTGDAYFHVNAGPLVPTATATHKHWTQR